MYKITNTCYNANMKITREQITDLLNWVEIRGRKAMIAKLLAITPSQLQFVLTRAREALTRDLQFDDTSQVSRVLDQIIQLQPLIELHGNRLIHARNVLAHHIATNPHRRVTLEEAMEVTQLDEHSVLLISPVPIQYDLFDNKWVFVYPKQQVGVGYEQ